MKRGLLILLIVAVALLFVVPPLILFGALYLGDNSRSAFGNLGSSLGTGIGYMTIEGTIIDSRPTVRDLKYLAGNSQVKAILIRIDSPGGVVTPSHEIYSEICRIRDDGTPIVVSLGTIAASGGYYVACPADLIVSNPGTLTGSIGVIMEFPVVRELMDKIGIDIEVIKSREHKDIGSPFRTMSARDRDILQDVVVDVYDQFVSVVSAERDLPEQEVRAIADGRIFTGRQALEYGLVDTLGTLEDAKRITAVLAGIKGEPRLIKPRRRLKFRLTDFLTSTAERMLGWPRSPRLSYIWP